MEQDDYMMQGGARRSPEEGTSSARVRRPPEPALELERPQTISIDGQLQFLADVAPDRLRYWIETYLDAYKARTGTDYRPGEVDAPAAP